MKIVLQVAACIVLVFALGGCHAPQQANDHAQAMQLKLYRVPADQSKVIAGDLESVLESSGYLVGTKTHTEMRVTQPFPGTVMVLAPSSIQPSIASAIDEMSKASSKHATGAPESEPLRVHFWVVQAKAGQGDYPPSLLSLEASLKQLGGSLGPSHFVLEDSAVAMVDAPTHPGSTAGHGHLTTASGHQFGFRVATTSGGKIVLKLQLANTPRTAASRMIPDLDTTITVKPGTYVVLAAAPPAADATGSDTATLMNLLVARVDRAEMSKH